MSSFFFFASYFFLIPVFHLQKEFTWSKIFLFSLINLFWFCFLLLRKKKLRFTIYLLTFTVFILLSLISFSYALDVYRSLYLFVIYVNVAMFLLLLHSFEVREEEIMWIVLTTVLIVAGAGFLQYAGVLKVFYTKYGEKDISSTFGLSNFAGEFLSVVSLYLLLSFKKGKKWIPGGIGILVALTFIIISQARASFVGLIGGIVVGGIIEILNRKIKLYYFLVPFAGIIALLLFSSPGKRMLSKLERGFAFKDSPVAFRIECWKSALAIFKEHPIGGVGLGNFEVYARKYASEKLERLADSLNVKIKRPHNDYLQILSEIGIIGFGAFIIFMFYPFYHAFKKKNSYIIAPLTSFVLIAFFSFPLQNIPAFSFMLFLAFLTVKDDLKGSLPRYLYPFIGIVLLGVLSMSFVIFKGEVYRRKGVVAYTKKNYYQALSYINKAIKFNRWESDHYFLRGQIFYKLKKYREAIRDFKRYVVKNPFHGKAYLILAMIEHSEGNLKEAQKDINMAIKYSKRKMPLLYLSAFIIYRDSGETEKAVTLLKEGLAKYPNLLKALNNKEWFRVPDNP